MILAPSFIRPKRRKEERPRPALHSGMGQESTEEEAPIQQAAQWPPNTIGSAGCKRKMEYAVESPLDSRAHTYPFSSTQKTTNCRVGGLQPANWTIGLPGSSHAETTLAGRGNVGVLSDLRIIQAGIHYRSSTAREQGRLGFSFNDLVRRNRAEEGSSRSNKEGKQKSVDSVLHYQTDGKRIL